MYKLTVLTSLWKGAKFLEEYFKGLTRQSIFSEIETVIINCDSPEEKEESGIIEKYTQEHNNIKYIKLDYDPGIYAAWNIGIKITKSEFITNWNVDDSRYPWSLLMMVDELEKSGKALCYSGIKIFPSGQLIAPVKFNFQRLHTHCFIGPGPVWRRDLHKKYGYFDESFLSAGDWEFWLRAAEEGFTSINNHLVLYRVNPEGRENRDRRLAQGEAGRVYNRYKHRIGGAQCVKT